MLRILILLLCGIAAAPAAAKVRGEQITLSAVLSLSGPYAATGARLQSAYRFAIEALNRGGGVPIGRQIYLLALETVDAASTPAGAQAAVGEALAAGGQFLLGDAVAATVAAAARAAAARGRAFIAPTGAPLGLDPATTPAAFFIGLAPEARLRRAVGLLARFAPSPPRSLLIHRDDPIAAAAAAGALVEFASRGVPTPTVVVLDFAEAAAPDPTLFEADVDAAFIAGPPALAATALRTAPGFVALDRCMDVEIAALAAAQAVCGRRWAADMAYEDPIFGGVADFVAAFETRFRQPPRPVDAAAVAAVASYAVAFAAASDFDVRLLRAALAEINLMTVYGRVRFGSDGSNVEALGVLAQGGDAGLTSVAPEQWAPARPKLRMPNATR